MNELMEIIIRAFRELPAERWQGEALNGKTIKVTDHAAGVDWSRGPWAKFKFTEDGEPREIQGFFLPNGRERVRLGDGNEFDDDEIGIQVKRVGRDVYTIITFSGKLRGEEMRYKFKGKNS